MEPGFSPLPSIGRTYMPISVVRLFLVRHAEALANRDLRYLGSRDDP